jgi:hypothetical protein
MQIIFEKNSRKSKEENGLSFDSWQLNGEILCQSD